LGWGIPKRRGQPLCGGRCKRPIVGLSAEGPLFTKYKLSSKIHIGKFSENLWEKKEEKTVG
jgi:hypothetical protein